MLKHLYISNYALIDSLEMEFPEGLIIITGETGAGKSILLGAISLLLGAKTDKEVLKDSLQNCVVEGHFTITDNQNILSLFEQHSIIFDNDLFIRRVITPNGRSRSFVNDMPVNISFLKELTDSIIDIHSQHQHLMIAQNSFQLSVLDAYCNNFDLLAEYQSSLNILNSQERERERMIEQISKDEQDLDYNLYQLDTINKTKVTAQEFADIESEYNILVNSQEIKESLSQVYNLLNPQGISIIQSLKEAHNICSKLSDKIDSLKDISKIIESSRLDLKEIEREVTEIQDSVVFDLNRQNFLEERINSVYSLFKKFNINSISELEEIKTHLEERVKQNNNHKEELDKLNSAISNSRHKCKELAEKLSKKRREMSAQLSSILQEKIRDLEMPYATFSIELTDSQKMGLYGIDDILFMFSANKDTKISDIAKIASGGELSRVMLCLKSVLASKICMPTLIFDEIDTGVSGSVADKMGYLIDKLSQNIQIFAITHLPQIASKGEFHLLVQKVINDKGVTTTTLKKLTAQERVMEVARLLSGTELSKAAIENAKEFLNK